MLKFGKIGGQRFSSAYQVFDKTSDPIRNYGG